jgi:hypothetical protein
MVSQRPRSGGGPEPCGTARMAVLREASPARGTGISARAPSARALRHGQDGRATRNKPRTWHGHLCPCTKGQNPPTRPGWPRYEKQAPHVARASLPVHQRPESSDTARMTVRRLPAGRQCGTTYPCRPPAGATLAIPVDSTHNGAVECLHRSMLSGGSP